MEPGIGEGRDFHVSGVHCIAKLTRLEPGTSASPDTVLFESRGVVLIVGDDAAITPAVEEVAKHHRTTVFAPGIDEVRHMGRVTAIGTRLAALQGRLGAFRGQVHGPDGMKDVGAASANRDGLFDLVLDLGRQPLLAQDIPPLGYFAPGPDPEARAAAVQAMRTLVGSFTKPRYFQYESDLCAHSASGVNGCTRCLQVCDAQAIRSAGSQIRVDPHLCQGCASCALACPTGALSFVAPPRSSVRRQLREVLSNAKTPRPVLVVHGAGRVEALRAADDAAGTVTLQVDPIPAFGEEFWLDAFAQGVAGVALIDGGNLPPTSRVLMTTRLDQARLVLESLGVAPRRLGFLPEAELADWIKGLPHKHVAMPVPQATTALPSVQATKRRTFLESVSRLSRGGAQAVTLPEGACFGDVLVDRKRCTLCFACANLCPTGALLVADAGTPQLQFIEDACVQCGLCERGCPEKAVSLRPRFLPQAAARGAMRVLNEDELLACTTCGQPFISARLLASSFERIKDHPVLAQGGRARLMTCPSCRQAALLQT